jgi:putative membrane protein
VNEKLNTGTGGSVIRSYSDHAANERTFLAWVRTGIAVAAFGFVIEKFNLFLLAMAGAKGAMTEHRAAVQTLSSPLGRYEGFVISLIGVALIIVAAIRFVRVRRLIEDQDMHDAGGYGAELVLSAALATVIAASSAYLVFDW